MGDILYGCCELKASIEEKGASDPIVNLAWNYADKGHV